VADDFLTLTDLAQLLGVKTETVSFYRAHSKAGRRYADHPFPAPDRLVGRSPIWHANRVEEIKAWDAQRPGRGVGGGRPRKSDD
jgi:predicted DNA-binding transcriptional regulator AlpA